MSDVAIRVEQLGKQYQIGHAQQQYNRFGERLAAMANAPLRRISRVLQGQAAAATKQDKPFWALKDVSFEIKPGEVVGIVGRNGAGKSTLLKILSRITEPSTGFAEIYGRVGSLLEVGTGFHPELTGRENVFLNGAILGMHKHEIKRKFAEIVAFAEVDGFIDTPVKHYSSGMYVRLAFAVAAYLDPEILLVDEVLAVGDVGFQRKCLGKINDVAQTGRTVLFVSHNLGLMQILCQRGIFIQAGRICSDGSIATAVDAYLQTLEQAEAHSLAERTDRTGAGNVRLTDLEVTRKSGSPVLKTGQPAFVIAHIDRAARDIGCSIYIYDHLGNAAVYLSSETPGPDDSRGSADSLRIICEIDELLLLPGRYRMDVGITAANRLQDFVEGAMHFQVCEGDLGGRPMAVTKRFRVSMPHRWKLPGKQAM